VTDPTPAREPGASRSDLDLLSGWLSQQAEVERLAARFTTLAEGVAAGVLVLTPGAVAFANDRARALLGIESQSLSIAMLRRFFPEPRLRASIRAALADGWRGREATLAAVPVTLTDGTSRVLNVNVRPLTRELPPALLAILTEASRPEGPGPTGAPQQDPLRLFGMYLAALANDLRGPLSASLAHLQALTERSDLSADLREAFALYRAVTEDTLARIARAMEWGRRSPHYEATDLRDVVNAAVAALELETFPGEIALGLELEAAAPLPGVRDQLQLAIEHVLRNACEALAPRGGRIEVALRTVEGRLVLTTRDDGPGIPPSLFPHVFQPFSSTKSVVTGLGLGLAIVKDIVGRHGGEVAIESSAGGTTVTLAFARNAETPAVGGPARKRRALIVDDDLSLRELYHLLFERAGWDVATASDSDQALQIAATQPVDAILVDVQMSGRDGVAVVEALATWHPHLVGRVALHTGYAEEARVRAIADRHGLPVVKKPCRFAVLLETLQNLAEAGAPGKPGGAVG
jgi:signal transduction histidine kinase